MSEKGLTEKERRFCEEFVRSRDLPEQGFHLVCQEFRRVGIEIDGGSDPDYSNIKPPPVRQSKEYPKELPQEGR